MNRCTSQLLIVAAMLGTLSAHRAAAEEYISLGVAASSVHPVPGWAAEYAIDRNNGTIWASNWSATPKVEWLAFWWGPFKPVNYVTIVPRVYDAGDGFGPSSQLVPQEIELYYSNGASWVFIKRITLEAKIPTTGLRIYFSDALPGTGFATADGIKIVATKPRQDQWYAYQVQFAEVKAGVEDRFTAWSQYDRSLYAVAGTQKAITLQPYGYQLSSASASAPRQHVPFVTDGNSDWYAHCADGNLPSSAIPPSWDRARWIAFAQQNKGRLYFLGDEVNLPASGGNGLGAPHMPATCYAKLFKEFVDTIRAGSVDPTARFSNGGFAFRLGMQVSFTQYADQFLSAYKALTGGTPPPIDEWRFHLVTGEPPAFDIGFDQMIAWSKRCYASVSVGSFVLVDKIDKLKSAPNVVTAAYWHFESFGCVGSGCLAACTNGTNGPNCTMTSAGNTFLGHQDLQQQPLP